MWPFGGASKEGLVMRNDPCKTNPKEVEARIKESAASTIVGNSSSILDAVSNRIDHDSGVVDSIIDVAYGAAKTIREIEKEEEVCKLNSKPVPITPTYTLAQRQANYRHDSTKRHEAGLGPITWWEYEAMVNKNLNPLEPSSLSNIENSILCPNGGSGSGAASGNGGGNGIDRGPSQSRGTRARADWGCWEHVSP